MRGAVGVNCRQSVRVLLLTGALALFAALVPTVGPAHAAIGGPVILGGDDLTDHGSFNTTTNTNVAGWLYIQKSLENI